MFTNFLAGNSAAQSQALGEFPRPQTRPYAGSVAVCERDLRGRVAVLQPSLPSGGGRILQPGAARRITSPTRSPRTRRWRARCTSFPIRGGRMSANPAAADRGSRGSARDLCVSALAAAGNRERDHGALRPREPAPRSTWRSTSRHSRWRRRRTHAGRCAEHRSLRARGHPRHRLARRDSHRAAGLDHEFRVQLPRGASIFMMRIFPGATRRRRPPDCSSALDRAGRSRSKPSSRRARTSPTGRCLSSPSPTQVFCRRAAELWAWAHVHFNQSLSADPVQRAGLDRHERGDAARAVDSRAAIPTWPIRACFARACST